jgi:hypothetical protein
MTHFVKCYKEEFDSEPVINRNKARASIQAILMDYSLQEVKDMLEYYVSHWIDPTLQWFCYNYEQVLIAQDEAEQRKAITQVRRDETKQRLEEWRNRWKKS